MYNVATAKTGIVATTESTVTAPRERETATRTRSAPAHWCAERATVHGEVPLTAVKNQVGNVKCTHDAYSGWEKDPQKQTK